MFFKGEIKNAGSCDFMIRARKTPKSKIFHVGYDDEQEAFISAKYLQEIRKFDVELEDNMGRIVYPPEKVGIHALIGNSGKTAEEIYAEGLDDQ